MNWPVTLGAISLGIVIGWLIRYFIRRFQQFTPQALSAVVSLIVGGGIVRILTAEESAIWFYFCGLLIGFLVYHIIFLVERGHHDSLINLDPDVESSQTPTSSGRMSGDGPLFAPPHTSNDNDTKL